MKEGMTGREDERKMGKEKAEKREKKSVTGKGDKTMRKNIN